MGRALRTKGKTEMSVEVWFFVLFLFFFGEFGISWVCEIHGFGHAGVCGEKDKKKELHLAVPHGHVEAFP